MAFATVLTMNGSGAVSGVGPFGTNTILACRGVAGTGDGPLDALVYVAGDDGTIGEPICHLKAAAGGTDTTVLSPDSIGSMTSNSVVWAVFNDNESLHEIWLY